MRLPHATRISLTGLLLACPLLAACGAGDLPQSQSAIGDAQPPTIQIIQPSKGAHIEGDSLTIDIEYADQGSGVSVNSLKVFLNGSDISGAFDQHSRGVTGRISTARRLQLGENKLVIEVADRAGNLARAERAFFSSGGGWIRILSLVQPNANEIAALALSPDGKALAAAFRDGTVQLWQVTSWEPKELLRLSGHRGEVAAVTFSNDGRRLASGGADRTIRVWDMTGSQPRETTTLRGLGLRVTALAFSPDGRLLASGNADRTVRLWDLSGGEPKLVGTLAGHSRTVSSLVFSGDGRTLASGGADGVICLWDVRGSEPQQKAALSGHGLRVISLAFAPDGRTLASSSADRTVRLWDLVGTNPRERAALVEYTDLVQALAFASGNVLTVIGTHRVGRWDTVSRKLLEETALPSLAQGAISNSDASRFVTRQTNDVLYVFSTVPTGS